jgi:putative FmdB family regulatory protein
MPMYDFECTKCGHTFEEVIPISAEPPACPSCGAPTQKMVSAVFGKVKKQSKKGEYYMSKKKQEELAEKAKREGRRKLPMP